MWVRIRDVHKAQGIVSGKVGVGRFWRGWSFRGVGR